MNRQDLVLSVLSTSVGHAWSPVQVQKVFFLLDEKIPDQIGGRHWNFEAYDYGPFDVAVYQELGDLEGQKLVTIEGGGFSRSRQYRLTQAGQEIGEKRLASLPQRTRDYIRQLAEWLRGLSFQGLVSAVYREFPAMRANSVFRE